MRLIDGGTDAGFALFNQRDKTLATGAAEQFIEDANASGRVLQPPRAFDQFQHEGGWVGEFGFDFSRCQAKARKGIGRATLAGRGKFVCPDRQFFEGVGQRIDRNPVRLGDGLPLLKRLRRQAGKLRLIADFGDPARNTAKLPDDAGNATGCNAGK
ncbi:MAG: hypothetical protein WBF87_12825 [Mesorhizobium sp.]